jgi:hypothetical protein
MRSNKEKTGKFKEFATKRTNNVLNQLRVLGNLSNRGLYKYSEEDIKKIFSEIEKKVKETKSKFHFPDNKKFKF